MTNDPDVIDTALLNDVLEDIPANIQELTQRFKENICNLVAEKSENKRQEKQLRKLGIFAKLKQYKS